MGRDLRGCFLVLFTLGCGASLTTTSGGTGGAGGGTRGGGGGGTTAAGRDAAIDLGWPDPPPCTGCSFCGNEVVDPGEACDDGNRTGGDGCTPLCQIERGWTCPVPGQPCEREVTCGDGVVAAPES